MKKRVLLLITPIMTLILEALPYGVKMNFATADRTITRYTSYFDTLPYFYATFSPLITAVLSPEKLISYGQSSTWATGKV